MVCTCVNDLKRLQSGGCCTTLMTLQLRYATGVFNLVCGALRAPADISEAESDRRLRGWLANDLRTLLPSPRPASRLRKTREQKSGRQTLAENPFSHAGYIG